MENKGLRTFLEALETTGFDALRRKEQGGGGIPGKGGIRYFGAARKKRAPPAAPAAQEAQKGHPAGHRPGRGEVDLHLTRHSLTAAKPAVCRPLSYHL